MNVTISGRYDSSNKTFRQMPSVANIAREPKNYLGVGMAEKEWNANPKLASKKFLHTGAYHNFLNEDTLILLGRTGTGKTSILKCIEYSINNKLCTDYTDVILEDFSEIFDLLLRQDASELESTTMNQMKVIIDTTVITMVMIHMVKKYSEPQQLKTTKNYLTTNGLYNNKKAIGIISTILNSFRMSSNDKISNIYNTISDIYSFITKQLYLTYTAAKEELIEFLSDKRVLVMFDSMNYYNMQETNEILAIKALISECFDYYIKNTYTHIYLKIALPSEVHTRILNSLPGKQQGNTVLIQWKYKELTNFVALRLMYWLKEAKTKDYGLETEFSDQYIFEDFYLDNENAYKNSKTLLQKILPNTCPTCFLFEFDTISYCMRHTLKKPRELLMIFNALIEELIAQKNIKHFIEHPDEIKQTIHSTQEIMVKSALSMYETSFKGINEACFVALSSLEFVFTLNDIKNKLKEAEQQSKSTYDKDDILRILFESGLVGVLNEIKHIDVPPKTFKTDAPFDLIIANFEYQIKGKITATLTDQYVIHPMCYEYYRCYVDDCSMVYPNRFADEEDIINTILKSS